MTAPIKLLDCLFSWILERPVLANDSCSTFESKMNQTFDREGLEALLKFRESFQPLNDFNFTNFNGSFEDLFLIWLGFADPNNNPSYQSYKMKKNIMVIMLYSLIVIVSLFGNLLVCYVILSKRRMRFRTTNILIANLTVSDLMMTVFNIPLNIARILLDNWPFGSALCKLVPFVQVVSVYVSTFSMTIIAFDRYQALVSPLGKRISASISPGFIVAGIWILAGALSVPHAVYNEVVEVITYRVLVRCRVVYPTEHEINYRQWITAITFFTQYVLPLSITAIAYLVIGIQIWKRVRLGAMTQQQMTIHAQSKRKTIKMLALVVVVFACCWFPLNFYHMMTDFGHGGYNSNLFLICHWLAMSSVCYNPFIYFWLNKQYRAGAKNILAKCLGLNQRQAPVDELSPPASSRKNGNAGSSVAKKSNENGVTLSRSNAVKTRTHREARFMNNFDLICVHTDSSSSNGGPEVTTKLTTQLKKPLNVLEPPASCLVINGDAQEVHQESRM